MAYNKQITSIFSEPNVRRWLRAHGKKQTITFDDDDRVELRRYFASLDEEGKGSIGIKELEEPLIALGLANSRKDVEDMIVEVDIDQSGNIEFDEFLEILGGQNKNKQNRMNEFFKKLTQGTLVPNAKEWPFKLVVSTYRRKMILDAMMSGNNDKREEGEKVMKAFTRQMGARQADRSSNEELMNADLRTGFPKLPRIISESSINESKIRELRKKYK